MPSIISRASRTIETAFLKYGMINFTLTLYLFPFGVTDKKSVLALEQYFIDTLNPEYNIFKIAGCSKGRVVPERTKNKLREERGNKIYAYSVDGSRLLYTFLSRTSLMQTLSIHRSSLNQALETGSPYINLLLFKLTLINNADNSNPMDLTELVKLCSDRQKVKRSKKLIQIVYLFKQLIYQILLFLLFFLQPEKWLTILEWIKVQLLHIFVLGKYSRKVGFLLQLNS